MKILSQTAAEIKTNRHAEVQLSGSHLGFHARYQSSVVTSCSILINGDTNTAFRVKFTHQNEEKMVKDTQNNKKASYKFVWRVKMSKINKRAVPNKIAHSNRKSSNTLSKMQHV